MFKTCNCVQTRLACCSTVALLKCVLVKLSLYRDKRYKSSSEMLRQPDSSTESHLSWTILKGPRNLLHRGRGVCSQDFRRRRLELTRCEHKHHLEVLQAGGLQNVLLSAGHPEPTRCNMSLKAYLHLVHRRMLPQLQRRGLPPSRGAHRARQLQHRRWLSLGLKRSIRLTEPSLQERRRST